MTLEPHGEKLMKEQHDALGCGCPGWMGFLTALYSLCLVCAMQGDRISNTATCMQPCSHNTVELLIH